MIKTGFLPEPLPVVDVPNSVIEEEIEKMADPGKMPDTSSPLFCDLKVQVFKRNCERLSVEQAMATYEDVFRSGLDKADMALSYDDMQELASQIGNAATQGRLEDVFSDVRLFYAWIKTAIKTIAGLHFTSFPVKVVLAVPSIDSPLSGPDSAQLVIIVENVYDEVSKSYKDVPFVMDIKWPGRLVIARVWTKYLVYLMRVICDCSV